ncbi:hypothetical protein [Nocardioides panaciterrulae]|uniref:Uncharacterized protein n=1 Tax=Nocardioides panaciterrulae TaxID=661492 RepID=A0A7Y9JCI9_9ACTN|nr:hypothetical protein [Nocardioides panaciterrulae]NYD39925.1 hypothetical protein [Nocardioides panaciterrulae]NYD43957.1 hypothetical protein [Nocardioides panaciterrulae]
MSSDQRLTCTTCRASDVDAEHVDRCAARAKARADAIAHGRGDTGIHATKTADLWAHIHTRTGDPEVARDITKQVIDLGWRPVVGHHDLWTAPSGRGDETDRAIRALTTDPRATARETTEPEEGER